MLIYINPLDYMNYRLCIAAREKELEYKLKFIDKSGFNEDVLQWNPHAMHPVIESKDIAVAGGSVIMEYLEDRYPFPPLYPPTPVERANMCYFIANIQKEWGEPLSVMFKTDNKSLFDKAKKAWVNILIARADMFTLEPTDSTTPLNIVDVTLLPLLWMLPRFDIDISERKLRNIDLYTKAKMERATFKDTMKEFNTPALQAVFKRFS